MDKISKEDRSIVMARVKSRDTVPEIIIRKLVFSLGYRFRLHRKDLPGNPDLVFPGKKKIVFVHGCFWHRHQGCKRATTPASNQNYWLPKFSRTVKRDEENLKLLASMGWEALIVWECELHDMLALEDKLSKFLSN